MKPANNSSTVLPISSNLSTEERLRILANLMVDRIIEEEAKYRERLKTDPNAKRIYETCECPRCKQKRQDKLSKAAPVQAK
jgi:hypothetical protein